jgi:hypothetical protein
VKSTTHDNLPISAAEYAHWFCHCLLKIGMKYSLEMQQDVNRMINFLDNQEVMREISEQSFDIHSQPILTISVPVTSS